MTDHTDLQPKKRLTLSDEITKLYELLMAVTLKPPHRGSESTSYSTVTVGDMKGRTTVKHEAVRGEDEEWDEYRARCSRQWSELNEDAVNYDAAQLQRDLAATLEKGKKS